MLSPRRDMVRLSKSVTNTPFRRADSDPVKQHLSFNGPLSAPSSPYRHIHTIQESPESRRRELSDLVKTKRKASVYVSVGVNTEVSGDLAFGDENGMAELNIEGALTDELKIIQVSGDWVGGHLLNTVHGMTCTAVAILVLCVLMLL